MRLRLKDNPLWSGAICLTQTVDPSTLNRRQFWSLLKVAHTFRRVRALIKHEYLLPCVAPSFANPPGAPVQCTQASPSPASISQGVLLAKATNLISRKIFVHHFSLRTTRSSLPLGCPPPPRGLDMVENLHAASRAGCLQCRHNGMVSNNVMRGFVCAKPCF